MKSYLIGIAILYLFALTGCAASSLEPGVDRGDATIVSEIIAHGTEGLRLRGVRESPLGESRGAILLLGPADRRDMDARLPDGARPNAALSRELAKRGWTILRFEEPSRVGERLTPIQRANVYSGVIEELLSENSALCLSIVGWGDSSSVAILLADRFKQVRRCVFLSPQTQSGRDHMMMMESEYLRRQGWDEDRIDAYLRVAHQVVFQSIVDGRILDRAQFVAQVSELDAAAIGELHVEILWRRYLNGIRSVAAALALRDDPVRWFESLEKPWLVVYGAGDKGYLARPFGSQKLNAVGHTPQLIAIEGVLADLRDPGSTSSVDSRVIEAVSNWLDAQSSGSGEVRRTAVTTD